MTTLTDTQSIILSAAAQRAGHIALPLPPNLRGGAATKVVGTMLAKGLLEKVDADLRKRELIWRKTGDGHGVTLIATKAGLDAIGIEPEAVSANTAPVDATDAPIDEPPAQAAVTGEAPTSRAPREGTKQAALNDMLSRPQRATLDEMANALKWASHTCRGVLSGALKKRLGLVITSKKVTERGRVYRSTHQIWRKQAKTLHYVAFSLAVPVQFGPSYREVSPVLDLNRTSGSTGHSCSLITGPALSWPFFMTSERHGFAPD